MIKVEFDQARFARDMERLGQLTNKTMMQVMRDQAGLLASDALKLTPPTGNAPMSEGTKEQQRSGEFATMGDVGRVFQPIRKLRFENSDSPFKRTIDSLLRKGNYPEVEALMRRIGFYSFTAVITEPAYELHRRLRNRRGRVVRTKGTAYWVANTQSVRRYVLRRIKAVGYAKSGWKAALTRLNRKIPVWVSRHSGNGFYYERESPLEIVFGNSVAYIQWAYENIMNRTWRERQEKLSRQIPKIEKALERQINAARASD